jgi:uncharacterized DUF497 family protein
LGEFKITQLEGCLKKQLDTEHIVRTICSVKISFDPTKNLHNIEERNLPFSLVENFDFNTAQITIDNRIDYGEVRYVAIGLLNERVHVVVVVFGQLI